MNHFISLAEGAEMTARSRANYQHILDIDYRNQAILPLCETFDKAAFETLTAKSGSTALRIYYGMDEDLKIHAIIVAVDSDGADILPGMSLSEEGDDDILERGNRCPDLCPPPSALNS